MCLPVLSFCYTFQVGRWSWSESRRCPPKPGSGGRWGEGKWAVSTKASVLQSPGDALSLVASGLPPAEGQHPSRGKLPEVRVPTCQGTCDHVLHHDLHKDRMPL